MDLVVDRDNDLIISVISLVNLVVDKDKKFKRFFFCLKGCINSFMVDCRSFLALDGAHISIRFKGILLSTIGVDGHNQNFPLAFGLAKGESTSSWTWFCKLLKDSVGEMRNLAFISDGHMDIRNALTKHFPQFEQRTCAYHMSKNFVKYNRGQGLEYYFNNVVATFYSEEKMKLL